MNRQSCVSVLSLIYLSASASGAPILLASYSQTLSSARSGWSEPRVQFELTLQTSSMSGPVAGIGRGVFWSGDASSFFDFDIDNSPEFPDFEGFATNGLNNKFTIFNLWSDGTGGGSGGAESALFGLDPPIGHPPDLIGYDLDSVRLIVNSLEFVEISPNLVDGV